MKKIISLSDIDINNSPKVRAEYRQDVAEEYAEQYKLKKNSMPLPVLFQDPAMKAPFIYMIGDGLHRISGMTIAGLKQHVFEVKMGTMQDCLRYALSSNTGHGIRRTNADKWHCVKLALKEFSGVSNGVIADYCSVSVSFVGDVQKSMVEGGELVVAAKRTGLDGKQRTVNPSRTTVETQETKENIEKAEAPKDTAPVQDHAAVPPAGEEVKDETGYPVPVKALPIWQRRHEIDPFLDTIEDLKNDIEAASNSKDALFTEVNFRAVIADLANIRGQLLLAKPYAVCVVCSGKLPETCKMCLGRGVLSKFRYSITPLELRQMREGVK